MTIQILGGLLVCGATTMLGLHIGAAGRRRAKELTEFKKSLILLKSQIKYAIYTLPQAFSHIVEKVDAPFANFYQNMADELEGGTNTAACVWAAEVSNSLKSNNLNKEDLENIATLEIALGQMDAQVQINAIDMMLVSIDETLANLAKENPKNAKMYRGLGVVGGLLITIVLI